MSRLSVAHPDVDLSLMFVVGVLPARKRVLAAGEADIDRVVPGVSAAGGHLDSTIERVLCSVDRGLLHIDTGLLMVGDDLLRVDHRLQPVDADLWIICGRAATFFHPQGE